MMILAHHALILSVMYVMTLELVLPVQLMQALLQVVHVMMATTNQTILVIHAVIQDARHAIQLLPVFHVMIATHPLQTVTVITGIMRQGQPAPDVKVYARPAMMPLFANHV